MISKESPATISEPALNVAPYAHSYSPPPIDLIVGVPMVTVIEFALALCAAPISSRPPARLANKPFPTRIPISFHVWDLRPDKRTFGDPNGTAETNKMKRLETHSHTQKRCKNF